MPRTVVIDHGEHVKSNFVTSNFVTSNFAYMSKAMRELPFTTAEFLTVCDTLKVLPFQNGEDDWKSLASMLEQIENNEIDLQVFAVGKISDELSQSPLFKILRGVLPEIKPPNMFRVTDSPHTVALDFTAKEFLQSCEELCRITNSHDILQAQSYIRFLAMIDDLDSERVNLLEFISTEKSDEMLQTCSLFELVLNTTTAYASHVMVDSSAARKALMQHLGWVSKRHVPPYPPSPHGLDFNQSQLLSWMQAAEADIDAFDFPTWDTLPSYSLLHSRVHQFDALGLQVHSFMAGCEPPEGSPGSIIFSYLGDDAYELGMFSCTVFFANIASGGNADDFLDEYYAPIDAMYEPEQPRRLTADQAQAFVSALPKVDVATIAKSDQRCSHCWSDFDEVKDGINNLPVQLPCDHRHLLGHDCLVEVLTSMGSLCPLCRVNIVALMAGVADDLD
jgi:hypothetical protein